MPNNTKVRSDKIAAEATKLINKIGFGYRRIYPKELPTLYERLVVISDCSRSTAVRHIQAALGLTDPVGRLRIALPVQRFNYRATDEEAKIIKPELKECADRLLFELRLLTELREGEQIKNDINTVSASNR